MISYTIEAAIKSGCFKKIFVSSDDKKTLEIASNYKIEICKRDKKYARNKIRVSDVIIDFIKKQNKKEFYFDNITCLFPTAPLRGAKDILNVVKNINAKSCHFSLAVTKYNLPPHQALKINKNRIVKPFWPKLVNKRDEQIGDLVVDNGSTYSAYVPAFMKTKHFFGSPLKVHIMKYQRSIDINTSEDLELAKYFFQKLKIHEYKKQ